MRAAASELGAIDRNDGLRARFRYIVYRTVRRERPIEREEKREDGIRKLFETNEVKLT